MTTPTYIATVDHGDRTATLSSKTLMVLWIVFWLLMFSAALQDALRNPSTRWWEPLLWEGSSALVFTGWMLAAFRVRQRYTPYLDRPLIWFGHYLRWLPLVAITFVVTVYALRFGVYALVGRAYEHASWYWIFAYESIRFTLFAGLWLGVLFGVDSYRQWQVQKQRLLGMQKALAEAQLAQLQGQLRPHFLFNALNTVSALMHTDVARADRLVATLGELLRISLRSGEQEMTPLAEELHTLKLYAEIMRERFRDRVTLSWQADQALLDTPVPVLLLQPLLENAFKHGVERNVGHVHVHVGVQREQDAVEIVVSNSGSVLAPEHRDGLGFSNCRERLGIIYGHGASLNLHHEADGVAARVLIPLKDAAP